MRLLIPFLLIPVSVVCGETAVQRLLADKLVERIRNYDAAMPGALGVAAIDLTTGRVFLHNADAVFPTASSIKIPIMVEVFRAVQRGEFGLSDTLTLVPAEAVGGSGFLAGELASGPKKLTLRDLITAMIEHSDNTATNRAIAIVQMDRVNRLLADNGFRTIRLGRIMMDSAAARHGDENVASPIEMARFVELLFRGKLAGADATREMMAILRRVKAEMRAAVPQDVPVASKPGDLPGVRCETGIVELPNRPFVLSVFGTYLDDGAHPVRDITEMVYEYFSKLAESNEFGNRVGRTAR